jgi:Ribbon-helix-helix protein, copG family
MRGGEFVLAESIQEGSRRRANLNNGDYDVRDSVTATQVPGFSVALSTGVVYRGARTRGLSMPMRKLESGKSRGAWPRSSISFPPEMYKTLEELAKKQKVSIGWVVREAVEKYLRDKWPLFDNLKEN